MEFMDKIKSFASDVPKGVWIFIVIVVLAVIVSGPDDNTSSSSSSEAKKEQRTDWRSRDNTVRAHSVLKQHVRQHLKAPSTAKFPNVWDEGVVIRKRDNQEYTVVSYVDAQNPFGAMIRTGFAGRVKQTGKDDWLIIEFTMQE